MSYKFVESVVLSPRDVKLDVPFMRELLHRWEGDSHDPHAPAPAPPASEATSSSRPDDTSRTR